ncbi:11789_t:CDS:1 [Racocetra fulgida]|uniref:11789_t:CDS:1 n=1 Tax=Racocetra fulgida TaxID=60492 RepID=A0A9N9FLQ7_9GLOM|nr:11789_t:CDS:1 [Racocetra fulgida]
MLNFQNTINLEEYINYLEKRYVAEILNDQEIINQVTYLEPEVVECDEKDDSTELPQVTHNEALNAIHLLELYFIQQDLSDAAYTEHDSALLKLFGLVRKFWTASFKQLTMETFFEPVM